MQRIKDKWILSASDLTSHLACEHLTQQNLRAVRGELRRPTRRDPEFAVLVKRGNLHEARYLEGLKTAGLAVAEIPIRGGGWNRIEEAMAATEEALRSGADIIYQATFFDGLWLGHADFLRKVPIPSDLGDFSYEVEDTKLALRAKSAAILQVCAYSELLSKIQGRDPRKVHIVLGDMSRASFRLRDFSAYFRAVKARFDRVVFGDPVGTYPDPVEHCAICRWMEVCEARRRKDDHLSLIAGMRRDQAKKIITVGAGTVAELAERTPEEGIPGIGAPTSERLCHQARLQIEERRSGKRVYELLPPKDSGHGLGALPLPTEDDLFFDMEGDPFAEVGGLEYLFGVLEVVGGESAFSAFWAHDRSEEKDAFEAFIDFVMERLERNPNLHVYHYANYEQAAVRRLMGLHATREAEVDRLLRSGVFVDLYQVVRQGIRVSAESYSIKKLEPLYMEEGRTGAIGDAGSSIVAYEEWLETGDARILDEILDYNRDDCVSTWKLRDWLESLRGEAEAQFGVPLSRPEIQEGDPSEALAEAEEQTRELIESLTGGLPADPAERDRFEQARWLLAQLLGWHRREAKADWWGYFERLQMSQEELIEDHEAIGGLVYEGEQGTVKQSIIHRYRYPADQDHKILEGDTPVDPATEKPAGTVQHVDTLKGIIDLKRGKKSQVPHPAALIPGSPVNTTVLREAVGRIARWVVEHGLEAEGPYRAVRGVLFGDSPSVGGAAEGEPLVGEGEQILDQLRGLAKRLEDTCLPVQGPPGSGKTYAGARVIVDLARKNRVVGVTASSHKVIGNLLAEVVDYANTSGVELRIMQKAPPEERGIEGVEYTNKNQDIEDAVAERKVDVVGGTPWLFARESIDQSIDHLFIDEAGQMSLANVVAVGASAKNIVLLGDPQQLAQPSRGSHPPGAEASGLEHVLEGNATIPPDRGVFLDQTYRLHPDVCEFVSDVVYEGRLESAAECSVQCVAAGGSLGGTGLRTLLVEHQDNRTSSIEEADAIAAMFEDLVGTEWTNHEGKRRSLALEDILVVAPYNAQVALLGSRLPEGARVGTVDKFQGQEAPVAIYSMATSSLEEIPRGMEFLYSLNRFNVAVSRARCLAVLVCSPALLEIRCRTPEQMRLVNAMCRFAELAKKEPLPDIQGLSGDVQ